MKLNQLGIVRGVVRNLEFVPLLLLLAGALSLAGCDARGPGLESKPFIQEISISESHQLALMSDGTILSWGNNSHGQLGNGTNSPTNTPSRVNGLSDVIAIVAGSKTDFSMTSSFSTPFQGSISAVNTETTACSLALKKDGSVWAWGDNDHGQLGNGSNVDSNTPVQVKELTDVTAISTEGSFSIALKRNGTVWAWGDNNHGQLGNGSNVDSNTPVQVKDLTDVTAISAGGYEFGVALRKDGTVWEWGMNTLGTRNGVPEGVGPGLNFEGNPLPIKVRNVSGVVAIAAGEAHGLALEKDGTVWAWGISRRSAKASQLGNGTDARSAVPVRVKSLDDVVAIQPRIIKGT